MRTQRLRIIYTLPRLSLPLVRLARAAFARVFLFPSHQPPLLNKIDALPTFLAANTLAAALYLLAGCSTWRDESVEQRVNRSLAQIDKNISAAGVASTRIAPNAYPAILADVRRTPEGRSIPSTSNPEADSLFYSPASESRDVAEKLRLYAAIEGFSIDSPTDAAPPAALGPATLGPDGQPLLAKPLTAPLPVLPPGLVVMRLSLTDSFRQAQDTGREYLSAEETYVLSAISLLLERHLWGPRLFNDTTVGIQGAGTGGSFQHALTLVNELRATQRLPYGGSVEAAWIVRATDQLREQATDGYRQSSGLILSGNIPLLRGAGDVAREDLIQAERNVIYEARTFERFRREYIVGIAVDYFTLLQTKSAIANQQRQLDSLRRLEKATIAKVEAGREETFAKGIASNRVQGAISSLANLVDRYILQLERFKIRLGLPIESILTVTGGLIDLPEPDIEMADAAALALMYRLDLQNQRDGVEDARRRVANAKNQVLPELNLGGNINIPTDPLDSTGGVAISPDDLNYGASATLRLPLDRERERLNVRAATINLQRTIRAFEQARDNVVVDVRDSLRAIDNSRLQLRIARTQVEINRERLRGLQLTADTVGIQSIVDAENDLLTSENDRDRAETALRTAVLNYLLASDQLRVARDGAFQPLPGMNIAPPPAPVPVVAPASQP